jgi:hypothetical protein
VVVKYLSFLVVVALVAVGCGKAVPVIGYPADGQKICLDLTPGFSAALADANAYVDTTIEVRVSALLQGILQCQPGNQQAANCYGVSNGQGFSQYCTAQAPCDITIIARRGEQVDVKTATIVRQCGTGTPAPK